MRDDFGMKNTIAALWIAGFCLALVDILIGGSFSDSPEKNIVFILFIAFLLAAYSLPFFGLWMFAGSPGKSRLGLIIGGIVSVAFLTLLLFLPLMRYLPNYKPDGLEILKYMLAGIYLGPISFLLLLFTRRS